MAKAEIISTIGGIGLLAGVFAYASSAKPEFTVLETSGQNTRAVYSTRDTILPAPHPVEIYALRAFSKNVVGERIEIAPSNNPDNVVALTRLSQNGGMTQCASYSVASAGAADTRRFCISHYPSGL